MRSIRATADRAVRAALLLWLLCVPAPAALAQTRPPLTLDQITAAKLALVTDQYQLQRLFYSAGCDRVFVLPTSGAAPDPQYAVGTPIHRACSVIQAQQVEVSNQMGGPVQARGGNRGGGAPRGKSGARAHAPWRAFR